MSLRCNSFVSGADSCFREELKWQIGVPVGEVYDRPRPLGFDIVGGPELSDCKTQSPQDHEIRERMDRRS